MPCLVLQVIMKALPAAAAPTGLLNITLLLLLLLLLTCLRSTWK
jgi:hypothetical protein